MFAYLSCSKQGRLNWWTKTEAQKVKLNLHKILHTANELWVSLTTHTAIFIFEAKKMLGEKKTLQLFKLVGGEVLQKFREDGIKDVAGRIFKKWKTGCKKLRQ